MYVQILQLSILLKINRFISLPCKILILHAMSRHIWKYYEGFLHGAHHCAQGEKPHFCFIFDFIVILWGRGGAHLYNPLVPLGSYTEKDNRDGECVKIIQGTKK